jgi:2-hydroxychromene-2-carboxylate isomerase
MRSVEALRATLATGIDPAVVDGFYRAYWVDGRFISTSEVIADVVTRAGHDAKEILAKIETDAIKDDLRVRTEQAIALGIFGVPAWIVDGSHLYWGQDRITFVEGVRPPPRSEPPVSSLAARRPRLDFYWDFSSPFTYLAAMQLDELARRTCAEIAWEPMLLGGLFRTIGTADVPIATFSEPKRRHAHADMRRWAALANVPFRFPSRFPIMTVRALRVYLALPEDRRAAYRMSVFRACWAEDRDITDDGVLAACVGDEATARDALARADTEEIKAALKAATDKAAARGVFGAPTFFVVAPPKAGGAPLRGIADGDELFWGQDRLDFVEDALGSTP